MGQRTWQRRSLLLLIGIFGVLLIGQFLVVSSRWINQPFPGFFVFENLTVGAYSLPGWSGAAAGIRSLDSVVRMDDRPIVSRNQLYQQVKRVPVGTPVRYLLVRDERLIELWIPTARFSVRDWLLSFGLYSVIGLAFLVIGVAPYFYRAVSPVALPLCFMVLVVFIWFQTTFDFMTEGMLPKEWRLFALALTPSAAIHLALMLQASSLGLSARPSLTMLVYGVGILLGAVTSVTFVGPTEIWIHAFRASYLYVCIGAVGFLIILGRALRRSESALDRSRLRVMFLGALLGFLFPGLTALTASVDQWNIPYNLALIPTIFFPVSVAYALLKYSLFDLGNALRVGVSHFALSVLLLVLYAGIAYLFSPWVGIGMSDPWVPIFFSLLVVVMFNPLLRWLQALSDRYIYRQDYDPVQVQQEVSLSLRTLDAPAKVANRFVEHLAERLGIENALLCYRYRECSEPIVVLTGSLALPDLTSFSTSGLHAIWPTTDFRGVARAEVKSHPRFEESRQPVLELFDQLYADLLLPLVYEHEIRGLVAFGPKRSKQEYSAEDFRLLSALTDQLALSLENARLYEDRREAYERVQAINRELREVDRKKKDFVANICHELRTPVSILIGYSEVLRELPLNDGTRNHVNRMVENGQELASLMNNLMDFSRMETQVPSANFAVVNLKEIVRGLEIMSQRFIGERPIKFGVYLDPDVETIESDGQKLQQILVQLLSNALKFTERGRIDLSFCSRQEREALEIAVTDTGIGIKPEEQEAIFDDFYQLERSSIRRHGGTGVGLGLCRRLAEALGGEIRVASEYGVGSVFTLALPVKSFIAVDAMPQAGRLPGSYNSVCQLC
jgi:signal transduction histidine kinase